ncbi:MAG: pilus assembly protein TadB [Pseudonocardiales bacterium]|nr:pilus assembly protein TadB [Pseudonocardiales bacterium]
MTHWWIGATLGLVGASGLLMAIYAAPPMRPVRLAERIAPYLGDAPVASRLLGRPLTEASNFEAARRIFAPLLKDAARVADRCVGGSDSVRRRLGGLGSLSTVEDFRVEQVVWGAAGMAGGAALVAGVTFLRGAVDPVLVAAAGLFVGIGSLLARDWWLSQQVRRRERTMLAEFPVIADLLALAVMAGEAPIDAIQRVCRLTHGELTKDLQGVLDQARSGTPIVRAMSELSERTTLEAFSRFIQGLVTAIERGTPLAEVLRAQAADVRELSKRELLEAGGRKEIQMMMPVVFMILPVTVLFALYPGLVTLVSLSN